MRDDSDATSWPGEIPVETLLGTLPAAAFVVDGEGVVRACNAAAAALCGDAASEALGRHVGALLGADAGWAEVVEALAAGVPLHAHLVQLATADGGALRAFDVSAGPLVGGDGRRLGTLVVAHDVSAPVRARLHAEARTEEMARQAVRRDLFFSAMSHDLRTPITAVMGYSELLLDGVVGDLTDRQHEMIERISQVAGHLSELLNDVLDLAKLDAGRMELHPEPIDLIRAIEDAAVEVEPQALSKGLTLVREFAAEDSPLLHVDPMRVRQVMVNLLGNAVKFTDSGEVRLRVAVDGRTARIAVQDTGPGLPDGQEEVVFEDFVQVASGHGGKKEPGSGLGLAISRRLARAMGGDLVAVASDGPGATFVLTLPLYGAG